MRDAANKNTGRPNRAALGLTALLTLAISVGCARPRSTGAPASKASSSATPLPTPTPRVVRAESSEVHLTMISPKGKTVAVLDAKSTNFDPLKAGGTLAVQDADAVLYEEGKPATRISARNLVADQQKRILTATGNVRAESLSRPDAPTARADRMIWYADRKLLTGQGKVLMTLKPDFELPGRSFTADTNLNNFSVQQDERPARGSF